MNCPGSVYMERGLPDNGNAFSRQGSDYHALSATCLEVNRNAAEYVGQVFWYEDHGARREFTVEADLAAAVQIYLDIVRTYAHGHQMLVEQRLEFSVYVGVPGQFGTSDVVILTPTEIIVIDLKFGMGVRVDAYDITDDGVQVPNPQMALYALGALGAFDMLGDFKRIRMVICQPRLNHLSEWDCTVDELLEFGDRAKAAAERAMAVTTAGKDLSPGEKQCKFCKAKATCPKLSAHITEVIGADFDELPVVANAVTLAQLIEEAGIGLSTKMSAVGLIEDWCKAVRAKVESELFAGRDVPGYKIVQGRQGMRQWGDKAAAEAMLKSFRLKVDEMYELSLISPTTAEKVLKESPKRWTKAQALISRTEGKPSVAPLSDKRPAMAPAINDFTDVTGSDLV
jgi:hypothetical protein